MKYHEVVMRLTYENPKVNNIRLDDFFRKKLPLKAQYSSLYKNNTKKWKSLEKTR